MIQLYKCSCFLQNFKTIDKISLKVILYHGSFLMFKTISFSTIHVPVCFESINRMDQDWYKDIRDRDISMLHQHNRFPSFKSSLPFF